MDARELRIGNLVMYDGEVVEIDTIATHSCWIELIEYRQDRTNHIEVDTNRLSPIPLTEQWLFDFGFDKRDFQWFQIDYNVSTGIGVEIMTITYNIDSKRFAIFDTDEGMPSYAAYKIEYVYQFQNLFFALTGQELTKKP